MPNTFAYVVLFSWPVVVFALFRSLPLAQALIWSIVGGFLLLPVKTELNLPMVPAFDKDSIPTLMAALMCLVLARQATTRLPARGLLRGANGQGRQLSGPLQFQSPSLPLRGDKWVLILVLLMVAVPFLTVLQNREPVIAGPRVIPGLTSYDALSASANAFIGVLPFLLAWRFLRTPEHHRLVLVVLTIAAVAYAFLVLFEVRMSPRLNIWIYGFFPHSWVQHLRGGFRPVVFLEHGLQVGIFLASALVAACALWKTDKTRASGRLWGLAALWLALALILSRNFGAVVLAVMAVPLALFSARRFALIFAVCATVFVLSYPVLRTNDWVPVDRFTEWAGTFSDERSGSLRFRFEHEARLLDRAAEKPLAGWGGWGRWRIHDIDSGRDETVSDGLWVIRKGSAGWLGYIAMFGLLGMPVLLLWRLRKRVELEHSTVGLMLIMAIVLLYAIPNAFLGPVYWLVAGALAGRYHMLAVVQPVASDNRDVNGMMGRHAQLSPLARGRVGKASGIG